MEFAEGKEKFIQGWGSLGSNWGISRSMAQVHALLLVSPDALSTEEVMDELQISRGNANMNLRDLVNWGIVRKEMKAGDRRDYFSAEKDIWKVSMQIIKERRKREIEPVMQMLNDLKTLKTDKHKPKEAELKNTVNNITDVMGKADGMLDKLARAGDNWFMSTIMKLLK